jgi:hypothetical protein
MGFVCGKISGISTMEVTGISYFWLFINLSHNKTGNCAVVWFAEFPGLLRGKKTIKTIKLINIYLNQLYKHVII